MAHATARAPHGAQSPSLDAKKRSFISTADKSRVMKSVIVHGPPGCGKTLNAEALRKGFKLDLVVDGWDGRHREAIGVLYLTNHVPARFSLDRRVFTLKEALAYIRRSK